MFLNFLNSCFRKGAFILTILGNFIFNKKAFQSMAKNRPLVMRMAGGSGLRPVWE